MQKILAFSHTKREVSNNSFSHGVNRKAAPPVDPSRLRLFDLKIAPIAAYELEVIWKSLSPAALEHYYQVEGSLPETVLALYRIGSSI